MCEKYWNLCGQETKSKNQEMNKHIFKRLLPIIGIYKTLIENGFTKEQALMISHKEILHNARSVAEENAKFAKMPFTYGLFKTFAKSHMDKKYPTEGFTVKYSCPGLCTLFCQSDITAFSGYESKIKFKRMGTLGGGANCCDFHFIHGNYCI